MRKRIFEIIENTNEDDLASKIYDIFMVVAIMVSTIPLMFYERTTALNIIEQIVAVIFIIDYILRLFTADYKLKKGALSFFIYPFYPMAIIDLVAILPAFATIAPGFELLRVFRLARSLRVLRALKVFRYSSNLEIIFAVIDKQKNSLISVCYMAFAYIFLVALVLFNVEPATFDYQFFNAIYWSSVSLTTTGYGDIVPTTMLGKFFAMFSTIVGIAVVALPSGIITAGFMDELNRRNRAERKEAALLKKIENAEKRARKKLEKEHALELAALEENNFLPEEKTPDTD